MKLGSNPTPPLCSWTLLQHLSWFKWCCQCQMAALLTKCFLRFRTVRGGDDVLPHFKLLDYMKQHSLHWFQPSRWVSDPRQFTGPPGTVIIIHAVIFVSKVNLVFNSIPPITASVTSWRWDILMSEEGTDSQSFSLLILNMALWQDCVFRPLLWDGFAHSCCAKYSFNIIYYMHNQTLCVFSCLFLLYIYSVDR